MKRKPDVTDLFDEAKLPEHTEEHELLDAIADIMGKIANVCEDAYYGRTPSHRGFAEYLLNRMGTPIRHPMEIRSVFRKASLTLFDIARQNRALRGLLEERLSEEDKGRLKVLLVQWQLEQANPDAGEDKLKYGKQPNNSIFK